MYAPSERCSRTPCPRTFSGELCPCCQTSGRRSPFWPSKAPRRIVLPSENFSPYFEAHPLKSGFWSSTVGAVCIRLVSGEESPKSSRDFAPILTVPFLFWIFGALKAQLASVWQLRAVLSPW